jgi:hypothetical protein
MTLRLLTHTGDALLALAIAILLPTYLADTRPVRDLTSKFGLENGGVIGVSLAVLLYPIARWALLRSWRAHGNGGESMYGLEHGRLHLQVPTPMWMNMGLWGPARVSKTLAEACRDLLKAVLDEAGFSSEVGRVESTKGPQRRRLLIDLGFGCGDQTIYLMSKSPVRSCDQGWWEEEGHRVHFDEYVGITKDPVQARYALQRVEELRSSGTMVGPDEKEPEQSRVSVFCADAATPASWGTKILDRIERVPADDSDRWVLALDTAYHFSPSRWPLIKHAHTQLHASLMAFDLCLSPNATFTQKLVLRLLTTLMGAPWKNFVTPDDYRCQLIEVGYANDAVKIVDVSEHVFTPLSQYLAAQDAKLKTLGLGIGKLGVAKSLFGWWGRSGVVRGVIVVARR